MKVYAFHRDTHFYVLELKDDADACRNADCNPGTTKVTAEPEGRTVWLHGLWIGATKH